MTQVVFQETKEHEAKLHVFLIVLAHVVRRFNASGLGFP